MAEIGIIGAGSWGTALAVFCVNNGHRCDGMVTEKRNGDA